MNVENKSIRQSRLKPSLFLPIEIAPREMRSRLYLAAHAAQRGFRVCIGDKESVNYVAMHSENAIGGVYIDKGGSPLSFISALRQRDFQYFILDEEASPAIENVQRFSLGRIYPRTESLIEGMFVVNEEFKFELEKSRPTLHGKVHATGWPRVDLWKSDVKEKWSREVGKIKREWGDFILFASSFGITNESQLQEEIDRIAKSETLYSELDRAALEKQMIHKYEEFKLFIDCLTKIDKSLKVKLIVRPHPSEGIEPWKTICKSFENIKADYSGEVTPWLLASRALVHMGSTVAIQANYSIVPNVYLSWLNQSISESEFLHNLSDYCIDSISEFESFLSDFSNTKMKIRTSHLKDSSENSSTRILDLIEPGIPIGSLSLKMNLKNLRYSIRVYSYRHPKLTKLMLPAHDSARRARKLQDGISKIAIKRELSREFEGLDHFKVRRIIGGAFEITGEGKRI